MKNPLRAFLRRYDPSTVGELSKIGLGEALYDPVKRQEAAKYSSAFTVVNSPWTGTHIIRDEDDTKLAREFRRKFLRHLPPPKGGESKDR